MEPSPFHPFIMNDQCLATTGTGFIYADPYQQILPISTHDHENQPSIYSNNFEILDSSTSTTAVHDHQMKLPACPQSNIMAKSSKRVRKQKKRHEDEENKKKMIEDSKEDGGQIGYIHVRARRGEATDSHSLAERITGKALMLDEVINYVQSLQNEIQILSLKLASVNPSMLHDYGEEYDQQCMFRPAYHQNMTTIQQQTQFSFQDHQMPDMIPQNYSEGAFFDLGEQRQELDDLFALINCNSYN
ncbi:hypothetical protein QVD17_01484 [Tagetes erecta]|uniref:Uncharacterized protein n=1 Tax=Tagetes erecta TaxID=13708 RepID=A0AAD8LC72_TARER|nr:hypothetical protein QVD17_01484 [Tagetes erecta]